MTTEEKARAYDEALEQAKKELAVSSPDSDSARQIFRLFPELKENNDERIRKWIFDLVNNMSFENLTASECAKNEEWKKKVLAYLEKQKEQNDIPLINGDADLYFDTWIQHNDTTKRGCFEEGIRYAQRLQKEQKPTNKLENAFKYYTDRGISISCGDIKAEHIEQKPAEKQEIIELTDFENKIKSLLAEKCEIHYNEDLGGCYELKELCKNILKLAYSQLQAELKQDLFEAQQEGRREGYEAAKDELKPAEWSEEDELMLEKIYTYLKKERKGRWVELLKSLRPSWKPSEEQMDALNALNCHGDLSYVGQQKQLISLYNDLKKL